MNKVALTRFKLPPVLLSLRWIIDARNLVAAVISAAYGYHASS